MSQSPQAPKAPKTKPSEVAPKAHEAKKEELGAEASRHADIAEDKAAQAAQATKESVKEGAQAASAKTAQAGEVVKEKGAEAYDAAAEVAHVAKEKAEGVVEAVQSGVQSAVTFVKEHMPPVEHTDPTPAERESQALMDQAAALVSTTPVAPVTDTGNYRVVNIEDKEGPLGDKVEVGPFVKPEYVHDVRSTAPEEVVRGIDRAEASAKGLVEGTKEFFREKVLGGGTHTVEGNKTNEPWVGVKMPGYADEPTTAPVARPATVDTTHDTGVETYMKQAAHNTTGGMHDAGERVKSTYDQAARDVAAKTAAAEDKAKDYYHSAVDSAGKAYHTAVDTVKDTVNSAEERVVSSVQHAKEGLEREQIEMAPKTVEEARLAHGEIPSSTEEVVHGKY